MTLELRSRVELIKEVCDMSKGGFVSIQLDDIEWIAIKKATSSKTMTVAVIRVPKEYAGRRFIVCLPRKKTTIFRKDLLFSKN